MVDGKVIDAVSGAGSNRGGCQGGQLSHALDGIDVV